MGPKKQPTSKSKASTAPPAKKTSAKGNKNAYYKVSKEMDISPGNIRMTLRKSDKFQTEIISKFSDLF